MRRQKQNILNTQNQSQLLISQRAQVDHHLLTKNNHKCQCSQILKNIETRLQLFELRLEQITANVNICFTKNMESYGKLVDQQKKRQNVEYVIWDMKQINKTIQQKINVQIAKQHQSMTNLSEQVQTWTRILRDVKGWKANYGNWSSNLQKNVYDVYKNYKEDMDNKLKIMYQAVEEIGLLQRKMLQKNQNSYIADKIDKKSRAVSYQQRQSMVAKKSLGHNDSTITYSRQQAYK